MNLLPEINRLFIETALLPVLFACQQVLDFGNDVLWQRRLMPDYNDFTVHKLENSSIIIIDDSWWEVATEQTVM